MKISYERDVFLVLAISYNRNEHSSNKELNEKMYMPAYQMTDESYCLPSCIFSNWVIKIWKTDWFGFCYDYIPLIYMNYIATKAEI